MNIADLIDNINKKIDEWEADKEAHLTDPTNADLLVVDKWVYEPPKE